jgi:hypothetical protein
LDARGNFVSLFQMCDELVNREFGRTNNGPQCSAVKYFVQRNRYRWAVGSHETYVATALSGDEIPGGLQGDDTLMTRNNGERRHRLPDWEVDDFVALGKRPALVFLRFKTQVDGLPDTRQGFLARLALADTTRDNRALRHDPTIFSRTENDRKMLGV